MSENYISFIVIFFPQRDAMTLTLSNTYHAFSLTERTSGSDKKPAKPVSLLTCDLGINGQGSFSDLPNIKREPGVGGVVPPHKMLSPEAVAATLPPLLEPDIASKPVTGQLLTFLLASMCLLSVV